MGHVLVFTVTRHITVRGADPRLVWDTIIVPGSDVPWVEGIEPLDVAPPPG